MQQPPNQRSVDTFSSRRSQNTQRTQPALPGVTQSTLIMTPTTQGHHVQPTRKSKRARVAAFQLGLLGILLELLLLALFPLLANITQAGNAGQLVQQALPSLFPWLPSLYWTHLFPALPQHLAQVPWLNISSATSGANVLLSFLLLVLASGVAFLAASFSRKIVQERFSRIDNALFWLVFTSATLFGLTMLIVPIGLTIFSQDMLIYGVYGHMVATQHANPYGTVPGAQNLLQALVHVKATTPYGPVWTDISVLLALIAPSNASNTILVFRILGLLAHLTNIALLWSILTRVKITTRLSATLLYAWNPFVLLFGIADMHMEIVAMCILLAAILFFQRNSPTIGWVFVLLTALINFLWLPLLPLFFRLMFKQSHVLQRGQRILWWSGMLLISLVVIVLAYAPYWHAIGFSGLATQMQQTFLQDTSINSLDTALLHLPIAIAWLAAPHLVSAFVLVMASLLLLLGLWIADTLELVALFSAWLLLILGVLLPVYWPWYLIAPLAFALCSTNVRTILLVLLLSTTSLLSYYWLLTSSWAGQAFVTLGVPLLVWGWILFFSSTWQMTHVQEENSSLPARAGRYSGRSRPSIFSRPSRPGRF